MNFILKEWSNLGFSGICTQLRDTISVHHDKRWKSNNIFWKKKETKNQQQHQQQWRWPRQQQNQSHSLANAMEYRKKNERHEVNKCEKLTKPFLFHFHYYLLLDIVYKYGDSLMLDSFILFSQKKTCKKKLYGNAGWFVYVCACSLTCGCCLVRNKTKEKKMRIMVDYSTARSLIRSSVHGIVHTLTCSSIAAYMAFILWRVLQTRAAKRTKRACECVQREKLESGKSKQKRQTHTCSHFCRLHDMRWDETQTCACSHIIRVYSSSIET